MQTLNSIDLHRPMGGQGDKTVYIKHDGVHGWIAEHLGSPARFFSFQSALAHAHDLMRRGLATGWHDLDSDF